MSHRKCAANVFDNEYEFNEDGTYRVNVYVGGTIGMAEHGEYRFEGTRLILEFSGRCDAVESALGVYEVELLENGNLKFTAIEDECPTRAGQLQGRLIQVEWEPGPLDF